MKEQAIAILNNDKHDDSTTLRLLIDKSASRRQLLAEFREIISKFAYREIDPRVLTALQMMDREPDLRATDASIRVCGTKALARRIRYWEGK